MSKECQIVKGISLFLMVAGILAVVTSVLMFMGVPLAASMFKNGEALALVAGIVLGVSGVFEFIAGIMGARGANNPSHLGGFIVLGSILVVVNIAEICLGVFGGQGPVWMNVIYAAAIATAVFYASRAKKNASRLG